MSAFAFGPNEDVSEYFDEPAVLYEKVNKLIELFKNSTNIVAYTGAGISTSANIPDYRSPTKGVWTAQAHGIKIPKGVPIDLAVPTLGHVALQKLVELEKIKMIVTTNVDGLHRRAGTTSQHLAELHGSIYLERCNKCGKEYLRSFDTATSTSHNHLTGRYCEVSGCNGALLDSIVHFGENLPEHENQKAFDAASASDLSLVFGTSMRVRPACQYPAIPVKRGKGSLVICNLQKTPYDHLAALRIFAPTDIVIKLLTEGLGIEIPRTTPEGYPVVFPQPYEQTRPSSGVVTLNKPQSSSSSSTSAAPAPAQQEAQQMFAVDPKTNCPHIAVGKDLVVDVHVPCKVCNDPSENWICLSCGQVSCSRHVNGHAKDHYETCKHPIAASFSDLSIWCYECDSYIKSPVLSPFLKALHLSKFGE